MTAQSALAAALERKPPPLGAVAATATCGAMVSIERAAGWSRQLRVTPLSPAAYVVIKMLTSLVLAAGAVAAVYLVGAVTNKVSMPADLWVITGLCVWAGSLLFAAFGLFAGYLLPSENVTQVIALALTLCSFAGGLFIPVSQFSPDLQTFAKFTPLYGLNQLVHYPLVGGALQWGWILNLVVGSRSSWPAPPGACAATLPECDPAPVTRLMCGSGRRRTAPSPPSSARPSK